MATKTKTTKTHPEPLYLLLNERREHGYFHLYARVVTQKYEHGSHSPYGVDDTYSDGTLYSGLTLACQGDDHSRERAIAGERDAPVYGYDCQYRDVYHIGRREAVRMAKTLTELDRKLSRLQEKRGYVRSYGEYLGRVAEAFGCAGIGWERSAKHRDTGYRWQWETIGYGITHVNRLIDAWVDEARPQPEPAAEPAPAVDAAYQDWQASREPEPEPAPAAAGDDDVQGVQ